MSNENIKKDTSKNNTNVGDYEINKDVIINGDEPYIYSNTIGSIYNPSPDIIMFGGVNTTRDRLHLEKDVHRYK